MNSIVKKPWGSYQILKEGKNHLVKNIIVKPGEKLSLQSHSHRSEHWIIVEGIARITINKTIKIVKSNESIFIPKEAKHRIENNNKEDLKIIEVQYGSFLQEDDIIRYEDIYNRKLS
jgi:mannose-6-phosphate isomerase-like protein (cupin superfamily)|tara:strand:+ start:397 stop:747 length:351 start_codon:yes stop_codon:yes gene_type:complete